LHENINGIKPLISHNKLVVLNDDLLDFGIVSVALIVFAAVVNKELSKVIIELN